MLLVPWVLATAIVGLVLGMTGGSAAGLSTSRTPADEWWLPAVGAAGQTPPGPGRPVIIVDRGLDLGHPDFAARPDTFALNPQTFRHEDDDAFHATALASIVGAVGRPGGLDRHLSPSTDLLLGREPGRPARHGLRPRRAWRRPPAGARRRPAQLRALRPRVRPCDREPPGGHRPRGRPWLSRGRVHRQRAPSGKPSVLSGRPGARPDRRPQRRGTDRSRRSRARRPRSTSPRRVSTSRSRSLWRRTRAATAPARARATRRRSSPGRRRGSGRCGRACRRRRLRRCCAARPTGSARPCRTTTRATACSTWPPLSRRPPRRPISSSRTTTSCTRFHSARRTTARGRSRHRGGGRPRSRRA